MTSVGQRVFRSRRFRVIGLVSLVLAAGFVALACIVIASPARSLDHPGGLTPGVRALAAAGCTLAVAAFGAYGLGSLRVALIVDESGLLIRNPLRTTKLDWESAPQFERRQRRADVATDSPDAGSEPPTTARPTRRDGEIICTAGDQQTWVAATSGTKPPERVDQLLDELRNASAPFMRPSASAADPSD